MTRPPAQSRKYRAARDVLRLSGAFITDYRAASVYEALERRGWRWNEAAGKWMREVNDDAMSEGGK